MDIKTSLRWEFPYPAAWALAFVAAALVAFVVLRRAAGKPSAASRRAGLIVLRLITLAALAVVLLNPVHVVETAGPVERPRVLYLVDASQSMALGKAASRWDQVQQAIREAGRGGSVRTGALVSVYRFGSRLSAAAEPAIAGSPPPPTRRAGSGSAVAAPVVPPSEPAPGPTDPDTQLGESLEQLVDQLGSVPPQAVVVFSDGRARDRDRALAIAPGYARMKVPVHVYPVGDEDVGGDVAVVSMVVPPQVRKDSLVAAQVIVRSHGYKGRRTELSLVARQPNGTSSAVLAHTPIVLADGLTTHTLTFSSGDADRRVEARIEPQPGEVSTENNAFSTDVAIDHTKIRVLYLEGTVEPFAPLAQMIMRNGSTAEIARAFTPIQQALMEDPDIECTVVVPGSRGDFSVLSRSGDVGRGLPDNPSELFAYDAIILSNAPREALSDRQLEWLEDWASRRGGGICLAGGPYGFTSGGWTGSVIERMLPVELAPSAPDWDGAQTALVPVASPGGRLHPIWHIAADQAQNQAILRQLPRFTGHNRLGRVKQGADVLGTIETAPTAGSKAAPAPAPAFAVQPFGRGRVMVLATAIARGSSAEFARTWGENGDARYFKKYWRNVVYWLTENSSIGRRRLLAETDKLLYRPGEPIVLRARTFDENAAETLNYRVAVSVEPKSATEIASDNAPLHRPVAAGEPATARGPLLPWGEEFTLAAVPAEKGYTATLPLADARSLPAGVSASQGLRIELTAYESSTQVDSTAIEVQVLDDPTEQQDPLPDHALLRSVAERSGGRVLGGPSDLASMLANLPAPASPPEVRKAPAWSGAGLLVLILVLLTGEWVWRRRLGLA